MTLSSKDIASLRSAEQRARLRMGLHIERGPQMLRDILPLVLRRILKQNPVAWKGPAK